MLIKQKLGNIASWQLENRTIDAVTIEWFEAGKRILHKKTRSGRELSLKFMNESQSLNDGDILWQDDVTVIVVEIQSCDAIVIQPSSMYEMASVCYEIGNKHLPLFYHRDELMVPFEAPLFNLLSAAGYHPKKDIRKLINPLKTTVSPHGSLEGKQSLFSKILQLTTPAANV